MQRQIEELSRKADQGSQQLQGEALEHELETCYAPICRMSSSRCPKVSSAVTFFTAFKVLPANSSDHWGMQTH